MNREDRVMMIFGLVCLLIAAALVAHYVFFRT